MSNILKNVNINPSQYFIEGEVESLRKFILENDYASFKIKTELKRVNLEIAKLIGTK